MNDVTRCPQCSSEHIYSEGLLWTCPECAHEWTSVQGDDVADAVPQRTGVGDGLVRDANGNVLSTGDAVVVIKDLKIKGSSSVVKSGTKVRNIRLIDAEDGHDIACKIDGVGAINLKSEFVKKA